MLQFFLTATLHSFTVSTRPTIGDVLAASLCSLLVINGNSELLFFVVIIITVIGRAVPMLYGHLLDLNTFLKGWCGSVDWITAATVPTCVITTIIIIVSWSWRSAAARSENWTKDRYIIRLLPLFHRNNQGQFVRAWELSTSHCARRDSQHGTTAHTNIASQRHKVTTITNTGLKMLVMQMAMEVRICRRVHWHSSTHRRTLVHAFPRRKCWHFSACCCWCSWSCSSSTQRCRTVWP